MVAARDIANEKRRQTRKEKLDSLARKEVAPMIAAAVDNATDKALPAKEIEAYAEEVALQAAEEVEAEYVDQEDEWTDVAPPTIPFGQEQSEARGILKDMHADKELGLASRTALTSDDQASAFMEMRVYHRHYPQFGWDYIVTCLEASRVSIGSKGRNQDTEILRGNVPLQQPADAANRPRTW